jgi:hypothetical protein
MLFGTKNIFAAAWETNVMTPVHGSLGRTRSRGWLSDIPVEGYVPWVQIISKRRDWAVS